MSIPLLTRAISLAVTQPAFHYVRLHRRHGTRERILPDDEIQVWGGEETSLNCVSFTQSTLFSGLGWSDHLGSGSLPQGPSVVPVGHGLGGCPGGECKVGWVDHVT